MSQQKKQKLPPNPFKLKPIRNLEDLAGRSQERKKIRYYLNLTASGDSPHLALIGQRGVGKTSLLNGAESIARELKLHPVRLDMNELKAESPGRFWQDLYQGLALSMAKVGCWGGEQGKLYGELLRMIHSRQPGDIENAVIQIPYLFSCHQGDIDSFECPDALVVNDINICLTELKTKGFAGIALLIDEADCLGKNVALIQMFRNIFQAVEGCSLVLAGTEAVFPSLSEVFSPIPRQFHRIDVKPFADMSDTMELATRPLREADSRILPDFESCKELHALCGGAPDEIQLYCHHMYRSVEDDSSESMTLSPQVFREVLCAYRANTPENLDSVLNAIERLPDRLLFRSRWVSRRELTLEENIQVTTLIAELDDSEELLEEKKKQISEEISEGYQILFNAGITSASNRIRLAGTPLTSGFWKSFVKAERNAKWSWNDNSFAENLERIFARAINKTCGQLPIINIPQKDDAIRKLAKLREGKSVSEIDDAFGALLFTCLIARETNATTAVDLGLEMESCFGRRNFVVRLLETKGTKLQKDAVIRWLDTRKSMLDDYRISLSLTQFEHWTVPTNEELHRLGRLSGHQFFLDEFGPSEMEIAVDKFGSGDVQGCIDLFERMLADKEDPHIRNNLAFCQIVTGNIQDGLENADRALQVDNLPLFELNKGVAEILLGDSESGLESLRHALERLRSLDDPDAFEASYNMVISENGVEVSCHENLPVDAALLLNLYRIGELSESELQEELSRRNPDSVSDWMAIVLGPK